MSSSVLSGIRHIVFDLGGVLLDIDFGRLEKAFAALGLDDFSSNVSRFKQDPLFDEYETGEIDSQIFLDNLVKNIQSNPSSAAVCDAWNALLGELPQVRIQLLKELRKKYIVSLLSNTNELHQRAIDAYLQTTYGIEALPDLFDKAYLSYKLGLRKPDPRIFLHVAQDSGVPASETLFIDDTPGHIRSASELGFRTFLADPQRCITGLFKDAL